MSLTTDRAQASVPTSKIRLARALVRDAERRGEHEDSWVERLARRPLPEDQDARPARAPRR